MILAPVKLAAECPALTYKFLGENGKMTNIIVGAKIIRCKIRFKMKCYHVIDRLSGKGRLVTVNIVRPLFTYNLHILEERGRMQYVVMIEQAYVIALCHIEALVRIAGYPEILGQFFVSDTRIVV